MGSRQIDADDLARGHHFVQQPLERFAAATSRIEDAHAGLQREARNCLAKLGFGERVEQSQLVRIVT